MRELDLFNAATGARIGTARVVDEITPGGLVVAFKADEVRVEVAAPMLATAPAAAPATAPAADPRPERRRRSS